VCDLHAIGAASLKNQAKRGRATGRKRATLKAHVQRSTLRLVLSSLAAASLVACGLSLVVDEGAPPVADGGPDPDGGGPTSDGAAPVEPDGAQPDAGTEDAGRDAVSPIRDGGTALDAMPTATCTPILTEAFEGQDAGLTLVGRARLAGGKLELLPRDTSRAEGAAYVNLTTPLTMYAVTAKVSTGALGPMYTRTDGLAVSALEKAVPSPPPLRPANDLGLTLSPTGQHGYGFIVDITPPYNQAMMRPEPRYVGANEIGPNARDVRELLPFGIAPLGETSFTVTMLTLGDGVTYYEVVPASGAPSIRGIPYRASSPPAPAIHALFLSASASDLGGGPSTPSPGFYVDDLTVSTCTP